jgi:hypothetical protein
MLCTEGAWVMAALHSRISKITFTAPTFLVLFGLAVYLGTTGAYIDNPDGSSMYSVTRSLALRGTIAVPSEERLDSMFEKLGPDGQVYSKYGIVQPLLQLPLFVFAFHIDPLHERENTETAVSLLNSILTATTLPIIYLIGVIIFKSEKTAILLALTYGFGTMAWLYATITYTEPFVVLVLLVICCVLYRLEQTQHAQRCQEIGSAGVLTGIMVLAKYSSIIYVPAIIWYIFRLARRKKDRIAFLAPLIVFLLIFAVYNVLRFGNPFATGYHITELTRMPRPIWYGIYTILFSVGKSVFIYAPVLILSLIMMPSFIAKNKNFGGFIVVLTIISVIFYAIVNPWCGAWSPGPRYHLPILPLLLLPLGQLFNDWASLPKWQKTAYITSMTSGIIIQIVSVSISYSDTLALLQTITGGQQPWGFWFYNPDFAPIIWQSQLLLSWIVNSMGLLPLNGDISTIPSMVHKGSSVITLNSWLGRVPLDVHGSGLVAGVLLIIMLVSGVGLIWRFNGIDDMDQRPIQEAYHAPRGEAH